MKVAQKRKAIFVTGTDTEVGKTIISGCLSWYLSRKGYRVITQKWVNTGTCSKNFPEDIAVHLAILGKSKSEVKDYLGYMAPYSFRFASSPHLAAELEGRKIEVEKIKKSFAYLKQEFDFVVVEGTGGLMVPFKKNYLTLDLLKELDIPVVIVAKNRLGVINHTLLTVEALKIRNIKILGIVFNNIVDGTDEIILRDNPEILEKISGEKILGIMPELKTVKMMRKKFIPIGDNIFKQWT